jgi:hypothetical protein
MNARRICEGADNAKTRLAAGRYAMVKIEKKRETPAPFPIPLFSVYMIFTIRE